MTASPAPPFCPRQSQCPLSDLPRQRAARKQGGLHVTTCAQCGIEVLNPRPTAEELTAIYQEAYYDSWNLRKQPEAVGRMKRATSAEHLRWLRRFHKPGRILDVGCATGFFLEEARNRGWDPWGVELSEFAAEQARERVGSDRIFNGLVEACPFPEGSFAAVTLMDCIEHVLDPNAVMQAVWRLLEPGGLVLMTTPFVGSLSHSVMGPRWTHYKAEHIQYYGRKSMAALLHTQGFRVVKLRGAAKTLSLDYIAHQFARYRHPLLTPVSAALRKAMPESVARIGWRVHAGDMLAIGRKAERPAGAAP